VAQVLPNVSAVAEGVFDPEHVHQLRVGLRRLRVAITELAELDSGIDPGWNAPLAALGGVLGRTRDRQLFEKGTARWLIEAGAPPLPDLPAVEGPPPDLCVQATEVQLALLAVLAFAMDAAPAAGPAFEGTILQALSGRLDRLQRELRRGARRFTALAPEQQHRVRRRAKHLRYLAEFIAPLFRRSKVSGFLDPLRSSLDALGLHNDEANALLAYQGTGGDSPGAWFAVGWLTARQQASAVEVAATLRVAGLAKGFWHGRPRRQATDPEMKKGQHAKS
jgi:CHAD domain-containing protein